MPDARWWREGAVVVTAFALCLLGGVLHVDGTVGAPPTAAYLLAAASSGMLLARHRAPVATMLAMTGCGMLAAPLGVLPTPLTATAAVVSAFSLAVRREWRSTLTVLVPSVALLVVVIPFVEPDLSWEDTSRLVTVAASPIVAAVLGRSAQHRRDYLAFVEERARRAEASRDAEARRRVAEERVRIARDLHDLVAHQITLANAQASVAAHLFDSRPEQARENLHEVVTTTRQALDELRATVGLLRQPDEVPTALEPAPGLAQLPMLLESFRRAGLEVSASEDGATRPLSPAVDLTAYRIIQEALTNVTKHSAADRALARLVWDRDRLTVTITDDGGTAPAPPRGRPGYGLLGLRERTAAVGGTLTSGPRPAGGFLVTADLPLTAARAPAARADVPIDVPIDSESR